MREILFRAKHIHRFKQNNHLDGEWVEGYLCDENHINTGEYEVFIDKNTICQYTGLIDKNKKRIWENDIVRSNKRKDGHEFYKVIWRKHYADFGIEPLEYGAQYPICYYDEKDLRERDYEKVGNIFDNLELMEAR